MGSDNLVVYVTSICSGSGRCRFPSIAFIASSVAACHAYVSIHLHSIAFIASSVAACHLVV